MTIQRDSSFIDFLKVLTLILVVIGHNKYIIPYNDNEIIHCIFTGINPVIYSFHMPLFFILSGIVYRICLNNGKYTSFTNLVSRKYHRLIIPFFITSIFIVFPIYFLTSNSNQSVIDIFIQTITVQNAQHLWFILDLFLIFIILYYPIKYLKAYVLLPLFLFFYVESYRSDIIIVQRLLTYIVWFYIGFLGEGKIYGYKSSIFKTILSICLFFVSYYLYNKIYFSNLILRNLYFFVISFLGCTSTIFSSNLIISHIKDAALVSKIYKNLKEYSFEIYLYSCPIQIAFTSLINKSQNCISSLLIYFVELIIAIILPIYLTKLYRTLNYSK